uniref:Cysteine--tRNA ligase n=1 Tax=mine drainage metagenome TaxID=410659 RepID=E6PJ68_9ZZZZ
MPLQLYNTRTRRVEPFQPRHEGRVSIYVCGLTPSAQAHLGHARSFLFFDILRRYLTFSGYDVTYVQNVTDIDDRSIAAAHRLGVSWREIVDGYYAEFKRSMQRLGVRAPDKEPYATEFIPQIRETIVALIERDYAYVASDGIYYRVGKFERYGALANRNIAELEAGARIEIDEAKEEPLDFALWKFAKPGEPHWPFEPYGDGRPGWHIECSAMSHALLDPEGTGFDIHGGGADLIFPHHENEIAQSEPLMARPPMANFWLHGGLLLFDNRKMSKSLGNFEPLCDVLDRYDPQAIRLLFLRTGYGKVMNFTDEAIAGAIATLERLRRDYRTLHAAAAGSNAAVVEGGGVTGRVVAALDDDMNTAAALREVLAAAGSSDGGDAAQRLLELRTALTLLGIEPNESWLAEPEALPLPHGLAATLRGEIGERWLDGVEDAQLALERVIAERLAARAEKDWARSDRLRDALLRCGIEVKDGKEGSAWSVVR